MSNAIDYQKLAQIPMFANFIPETLSQLAQTCRVVDLERNEVLFQQGSPSNALYLVDSGRLHIVSEHADERMIVQILTPGDVTGEISMIIGEPRTATVEAVERSCLIALSRDAFFDALGKDPAMASQLIMHLGKRFQDMRVRQREIALDDADARLAGIILFLAEEQGEFKTGVITNSLRQRRLARSVGVDLDWIDQKLHEWSNEGFIGLDRRRLLLHDVEALKEIAGWQ